MDIKNIEIEYIMTGEEWANYEHPGTSLSGVSAFWYNDCRWTAETWKNTESFGSHWYLMGIPSDDKIRSTTCDTIEDILKYITKTEKEIEKCKT